MSITTVISDLGGVLLDFDNGIYERKLALATGQPVHVVQALLNEELLPELHLGNLTPEQFHRSICTRLDTHLSLRDLAEIYSNIFTPKPETVSLLRDLQSSYRLCLLSNTNAIHWDYCQATYPFLALFEHHILSHEAGTAKPEPAIYEKALKAMDADPADCVYIDDVWVYADVATALGMRGITFTTAAALEADLSRVGVRR
jgi:glucose-1-phosphatase